MTNFQVRRLGRSENFNFRVNFGGGKEQPKTVTKGSVGKTRLSQDRVSNSRAIC